MSDFNKYTDLTVADFADKKALVDSMTMRLRKAKFSDHTDSVSLFAKHSLIRDVLKILITDYHFNIGFIDFACDYFDDDYNAEYSLTIYTDNYLAIDKVYNDNGEIYDVDGIAYMYDEDVTQELIEVGLNSEADVILFSFEDKSKDFKDETHNSPNDKDEGNSENIPVKSDKNECVETPKFSITYRVDGKEVDKDTYLKTKKKHSQEILNMFADNMSTDWDFFYDSDKVIYNIVKNLGNSFG